MQPKSKWRIYVSFDDGAGAVKYYNTEIRNVLTSQNFKQITPPQTDPREPSHTRPSLHNTWLKFSELLQTTLT